MTTLVNQKGPSNKKKGRSKKGHVLSAAVQRATQNFVEKGEEIADENPDMRVDMLAAVEEVRSTGTVYARCSKILNTSCLPKRPRDSEKQHRPRSDCFWKSSLNRVFPVCYSDKHFVNPAL